jgi:hypothetical protein
MRLLDCVQVFLESIRQFLEGRPGEVGEAVFDKEDDLAVEFVTAAANLRAAAYNIPRQSLFNTKVCGDPLDPPSASTKTSRCMMRTSPLMLNPCFFR